MEYIKSLSNEKIKEAAKLSQKKYREESGFFLAEGLKTIQAAYDNNYEIERIFVLEEKANDYDFIKEKIIIVSHEVMKKISTTDSATTAIAVIKSKRFDEEIFKKMNKILLLENVKDPGNLGTIIRSAVAFGIEGLIFCGECVDIYNTKVLRSTVGTAFMLPWCKVNVKEIKCLLPSHEIISTTLRDTKTYSLENIQVPQKYVIAFGSEASGITEDMARISDKFLKIEHSPKVESLNLSVAASIVLWALNKI